MAEKRELSATVRGFVQGVGFRDFVQRAAFRMGLTGYTKNLPDGSVLVVAQGDRESLERLVERLDDGPGFAEVTEIEVEWREPTEEFDRFDIVY